ncbi:hypothetical protein PGTUg99_032117 [Puccinia graminis f. sp. tritici]|uniref:Tyr recombinase domain-containing protein n=1 Tax=Puccinia graminis f. sp. tritici TaxID=56615 RepID=A0A5B0S7Z1_PUCGR|nr:hypothetical protein PGTUg99_032117 [Puccinia graminis f. sp. tritici]
MKNGRLARPGWSRAHRPWLALSAQTTGQDLPRQMALPGHPQLITVAEQKHVLCPVMAIKRRLSSAGGKRTSLFGYGQGDNRRHLTRNQSVARLETVLLDGGYTGLKGHSFRVGGASFRAAFGMSHSDICILGRWKSDCYKLYLREYSPDELKKSKALVRQFKRSWSRMVS